MLIDHQCTLVTNSDGKVTPIGNYNLVPLSDRARTILADRIGSADLYKRSEMNLRSSLYDIRGRRQQVIGQKPAKRHQTGTVNGQQFS